MNALRFMLDTNIVSAIMRSPQDSPIRTAFDAVGANEICISLVTAAELKFGLANRPSDRLAKRLEDFFAIVVILPLEPQADDHYASIRAYLSKAGRPIGANDLFIAAHARSLGLTLVTANVGEFSRVPNLRIENWLD